MTMNSEKTKLFLALGALTLGSVAHAQAVDTSDWACEYCPFEDGHSGDYEVGASQVSDDSAYFGNFTGYDEEGTYANVDGDGSYGNGGYRMRWLAEDLALDSRVVELEGSRVGVFDYNLGFSQIPQRKFITTSTVFAESGSTLSLPSSWVPASTTDGFTALGSSLVGRNIESDRSIFEIGGRYIARGRVSFTADYRRQEQDGLKIKGGPAFTNSSLLPMPFDYSTDEVDLGIRYDGDNAYMSVSWYMSDFRNDNRSLTWDQPFSAVAGAETVAQAQAAESRFQQLTLAGGYALPELRTVISASGSLGRIDQNTLFLQYTTNPNLSFTELPRTDLAADVDTTNFAASLTSRVADKGRIRFTYRYDERDNKTAQDLWARVIVDSFPTNDFEPNIPYSFERQHISISGDYDLLDQLRLSAGYDLRKVDRKFQEVTSQDEDTGWGRVRWKASASIELDVGGGTSRRDFDSYDEALAVLNGQNPLMRKYHMAYRYREFGDLEFTWSPSGTPISIALNGLIADDSYSRSELGLISGRESSASVDFGWSTTQNSSLFLNVGYDRLESTQLGSESASTADWTAENDDTFTTIGAGFNIRQIGERFDLTLDYTRSEGTSEIGIDSAAAQAAQFPDLETTLDYLRLRLGFEQSARLAWNLDLRYQSFKAEDWALEGVAPDAIPLVLSLGALPYDDETVIVGIGVRYRMGAGEE
jgi:MtrB/PioB family decaheme-associated outer membrane protein